MASETSTPATMNIQVPPNVAIVVLNWNGANDTLECLNSLVSLTYPNFSVIVVDNGSTDNSLGKLRAYSSPFPLVLLETGKNLGYAGGNNVGTRHALEHGADFVLLLNNDTTVAPDLLEQLINAAQRSPDAGVFSARVMYFDNPDLVWFDGARWNESSLRLEWPGQGAREAELSTMDRDTDYACGAALFFRAEVARKIGLLDEAFFLVWEEVDWCFRARKAGWHNKVVAAAKVWHKIGVSFGSESSPLRTYFSIRNQLLWFSRHASLSARLRLWTNNLRRLIPKFHVSTDLNVSVIKRFVWAIQDYGQAWLGRGSRLQYMATRRAIMDYVRGRFGDCPDEVRAWSKAWAAQQQNS
ncbi:glycosyltransferase family 2 protein [Candidatus Nitrotoga sp. HW29]|uniref:glycosyltransferase family 2 protein n=1 Tax=Candidatus Nitrotoga sp. HW29 TaxID=2886963 RepID=UPI001EF2B0EC|nr:glycosyltransferase family 2 protein [Candidatus Nitrotoga sp. HW29]